MADRVHSGHHRLSSGAYRRSLQARLDAAAAATQQHGFAGPVSSLSSSSSTSLSTTSSLSSATSGSLSLSGPRGTRGSLSSRSSASDGSDKGNKEDDLDWDKLVKACKVIILYKHPRYVEVQAVLKALKSITGHQLKNIHLRRLKRYALDALPYAKYAPSPVLSRSNREVVKNKSTTPQGSPPRSRSSISSAASLLQPKRNIDASPVSSLDLDKTLDKSSPVSITRAPTPSNPASLARPSSKTSENLDGVNRVLRALDIAATPASRSASPMNPSLKSSPSAMGSPGSAQGIPTKRRLVPSSLTMSASSSSSASSCRSQMRKIFVVVERLRKQARDVLLMYQNEILG